MASILKPKPAATLIITKKINNNLCILMGKRPENAKFAPGMWVFPGGKLDKNDIKQNNKYKLNKNVLNYLELLKAEPPIGEALIHTAIRETKEETNLSISSNNLEKIWILARAITPVNRHMRFDTKFFVAPSSCFTGKIKGNGELDKLEYVNINDALKLPMFDITEFVLKEIKVRTEKGDEINSNPVFWRYRKQHRLITEIKKLD